MKNPAHFSMAEELNTLFDTDRTAALNKAIDYVNTHAAELDRYKLERRSRILPTRMDMLLNKETKFTDAEANRFMIVVIELCAEHGRPIEPEF